MVVEPCSHHLCFAPGGKRYLCVDKRREIHDIKCPEDRLDLAELVLPQIGPLIRLRPLHLIEVVQDGSGFGDDGDICAVCLELLIDLVSHVHHDIEHGCRQRSAQGDRQGDHQHLHFLTCKSTPNHSKKHIVSFFC